MLTSPTRLPHSRTSNKGGKSFLHASLAAAQPYSTVQVEQLPPPHFSCSTIREATQDAAIVHELLAPHNPWWLLISH